MHRARRDVDEIPWTNGSGIPPTRTILDAKRS
jgi:hypothetical protein